MKVEVSPEPSDAERQALLLAVEQLLVRERDLRTSAWWRAGIRENVETDEP
jgi:hypothetical protein